MFILNLIKNLINYQLYLVNIFTNLFIVSSITFYQFIEFCFKFSFLNNSLIKAINFRSIKLLNLIRKKSKKLWNLLNYLIKRKDLSIKLIDDEDEHPSSIFNSNHLNDRILFELIEKMDTILNHINYWPNSIRQILLYVESRLLLEADYASRILNFTQSTRSQLNNDEGGNFMDFRPIFVTIVNSEFGLSNQVIQCCETLLTSEFINPLEELTKEFKQNLIFIKRKWGNKINELQTLINQLRKEQKLYLQCALYYVKSNDLMNKDELNESFDDQLNRSYEIKNNNYLKREKKHELYKIFLIKCEKNYQSKINDVNCYIIKLEKFKNQVLDEIQLLIDNTSKEIRKLCSNYINKLYPNQKTQLLDQLLNIIPEFEFRKYVLNLNIPEFPTYQFRSYDEIKC